ncbi:hypothetical protein HO173_012082 [Letharia columbiana]|uniref:Uncharacterized protein n=1 Tax=Letharia columbiana TaxID=112416 RepID=A0A8H6CQA0_9LECA|nr:uncharacterized protein HO173_012082 [Letharia columbiana]KAF6227642.1 hypothetical protein HO173_012082 [Letharia columbiana]
MELVANIFQQTSHYPDPDMVFAPPLSTPRGAHMKTRGGHTIQCWQKQPSIYGESQQENWNPTLLRPTGSFYRGSEHPAVSRASD